MFRACSLARRWSACLACTSPWDWSPWRFKQNKIKAKHACFNCKHYLNSWITRCDFFSPNTSNWFWPNIYTNTSVLFCSMMLDFPYNQCELNWYSMKWLIYIVVAIGAACIKTALSCGIVYFAWPIWLNSCLPLQRKIVLYWDELCYIKVLLPC